MGACNIEESSSVRLLVRVCNDAIVKECQVRVRRHGSIAANGSVGAAV